MKKNIRILFLITVFVFPSEFFAQTNIITIPDLSDVNVTADTLPEFIGGKEAYDQFLSENLKYPLIAYENKEQGRVVVRFVVESNGKITRAHILKSVSPTLDAEVLRFVNSMPDWLPGKIGEKCVAVMQNIPFTFKYSADDDKIYDVVEIPPTFQGGDNALMDFLSKNTHYPDSARELNIQGKVVVQFVVWKDGSIRNVKVVRSAEESLDKEAIRVVSAMPTWNPGKQSGKNVNCTFFVPVNFEILNSDNKSSKKTANTTKNDGGTFLDIITIDNRKIIEADFPGGVDSLNAYFNKNMIYPEVALKNGVNGVVEVAAEVDKTGKIVKSWVANTTSDEFSNEALRLINSMPKFNPRTVDGKPQKSELIFSIPFVTKNDNVKIDSLLNENIIYEKLDTMPSFPGGENANLSYLSRNIKYPVFAQENNIQGNVICEFIVSKDGTIRDVKVIKGVDQSLDKEAVRVIKNMPNWIPGKYRGKNVNCRFFMPINFRLQ